MQPDPPDLWPDAPAPDLAADRLEGHALTDVRLAGPRLHLSLVDCALAGCDLANLDARGGAWRRVAVRGGRLTGLNVSAAALSDVSFAECRADLTAWAEVRLDRVRFEDCDLRGADFADARMRLVVFERCDLRDADLAGAAFELVEFRGVRLDGVRGVQTLTGVRLRWGDVLENAGVFAAACGLTVLDD